MGLFSCFGSFGWIFVRPVRVLFVVLTEFCHLLEAWDCCEAWKLYLWKVEDEK